MLWTVYMYFWPSLVIAECVATIHALKINSLS